MPKMRIFLLRGRPLLNMQRPEEALADLLSERARPQPREQKKRFTAKRNRN